MADKSTDNLDQTIQREAIMRAISTAFFSVESAVTIALTIALTGLTLINFPPLAWSSPIFWVVAGVVAEVILIGVSLTDPEHWRKVAEEHLAREYNPSDVKNIRSRERLDKALVYRVGMEDLIRSTSGPMRINLRQTADEMEKGIELIYDLGRRLDSLQANALLIEDIQTVPQAIKQLKQRIEIERDPGVRTELEHALQSKQAQLDNLRQLENTMKRADIQIDNMLAAMGASYTQMQLIGAKDIDSGKARRLREDVAEQVAKTQDVISAMDEVQQLSAM
ncbi:MAG: hypothetical protein JXB47_14540 [Anaerolineae bacterium]|nr:hypothetical protein [Anaerolineae bacterium]